MAATVLLAKLVEAAPSQLWICRWVLSVESLKLNVQGLRAQAKSCVFRDGHTNKAVSKTKLMTTAVNLCLEPCAGALNTGPEAFF